MDESVVERVGPVLLAGAGADALVAAIRDAHPDVLVIDRGAYVRVLVPDRCRVERADVERHAGVSLQWPGDLELIMPSFQGVFVVSSSSAVWEHQRREAR